MQECFTITNSEGQYDHIDLIDCANEKVKEIEIPGKLVTAKLKIFPTGLTREWYIDKRKDNGTMTWIEVRKVVEK